MESSSYDSRIAAMRVSFPRAVNVLPARRAPVLIAVGFLVLLAGACWPAMPVVTGMALVALGASVATAHQLRSAPISCVVIAAHLFVYLNLYLLFVGAVCHAATQAPQDGLTLLQNLDLGGSVVPMALVVRRSVAAIAGGGDAPAR
jgi:hypothetical protein